MKNVAFISAVLSLGGAEKIGTDLSRLLHDENYNKYYIVYDGDKTEYSVSGKLINLNSKKSNNPLKKIFLFYERCKKIKTIKKLYKIDTTISHLDNPNIINILTKQTDKVIITVHSFQSKRKENIYKRFYQYLIRYFYNKADVIVAVSEEIKKDLIQNFDINDTKIIVIPNFIDTTEISKLSEESLEKYSNIFNNSKVVINVGRLVEAKGQWHLIRAFKKVNCKNPDLKLVIIGEGRLNPYLETLRKNLGLENSVFLIGSQKNPYRFLKNSTVFVMSSLFEGFGLVLLEAMACGVPVISTNCKTGPASIIAPSEDISKTKLHIAKFGLLVPVFDGKHYDHSAPLTQEEETLADAILYLLNNNELKLTLQISGYKRVENYAPENIIQKWTRII